MAGYSTGPPNSLASLLRFLLPFPGPSHQLQCCNRDIHPRVQRFHHRPHPSGCFHVSRPLVSDTRCLQYQEYPAPGPPKALPFHWGPPQYLGGASRMERLEVRFSPKIFQESVNTWYRGRNYV